ncbi:MAG: ParB/RepB/Spo0J family partition protein [Phycisphaeraceae bacterium]
MAQSVSTTPPADAAADDAPATVTTVPDAPPQPATSDSQGDAVESESTGPAEEEAAVASEEGGVTLSYVPVDRLQPNPHQPRQHFDEASLRRLAESIRSDGLMQPIVIRPVSPGQPRGGDATYEIVAGERRWRAARLAELAQVPAIVRELDDRALAEWALIENLQREDLNPIERAEAFSGLAERFGLSHDEIARRVGLERATISNLLRLLKLSEEVKRHVRDGLLSMGQARAIAAVPEGARQLQLAERAVKQGLSVRQVEQLARQGTDGGGAAGQAGSAQEPSKRQVRSAYLADLEQQLAEQLQTRVKVRPGRKKGSGTLTIEFYSLDQFDALMEKLGVSAE